MITVKPTEHLRKIYNVLEKCGWLDKDINIGSEEKPILWQGYKLSYHACFIDGNYQHHEVESVDKGINTFVHSLSTLARPFVTEMVMTQKEFDDFTTSLDWVEKFLEEFYETN